jgi:hypothetical protein
VYIKLTATFPAATQLLVERLILKPLQFPAFGRGGGGFAVGGELFVVEGDGHVFRPVWFSVIEQLGV